MKNYHSLVLIIIVSFIISCSTLNPLLEPNMDYVIAPAPNEFIVEFETTKGKIKLEIKREYSPLAVDRFYYLASNNYYNYNRFFRVLPNFVVQWGMKGNPKVDKIWGDMGVKDEPVKLSNTKGTISFARSGPNTRSNQLFINLVDNTRLDTSSWGGANGFPGFGKVIEGMEIVESINSEYMQEPNQDSISTIGNTYLNRNFPNLDYIISSKVIEN